MMRGRPATLSADEQYCQDLTRREAANFYWGFVALPRPQRSAIYALYSFARQVDDEVDLGGAAGAEDARSGGTGTDRFALMRDRVERCFTGRAEDPVMRVLAHVVDRYRIPREDLEALIHGVEMDLRVSRYQSWEDLQTYCRLVASSVGRMCVRIFGFSDLVALEYADDLGVAMQVANILRDVREDMERGRIYLPQDELRRFGVSERSLMTRGREAGWEPLMRHQIARAKNLFASGLRVTEVIPRRAAACVLTMAGIYQAIVAEIEHDPYLPLRRRAALSRREKLSVMLKSWLQAL
jgi:15-cis-phytoene synthase